MCLAICAGFVCPFLLATFQFPAGTGCMLRPGVPRRSQETVQNPYGVSISLSQPGRGLDQVRGVHGGPNPAQVGEGGNDHHRADWDFVVPNQV